jgi:pyruvate, water dikinase
MLGTAPGSIPAAARDRAFILWFDEVGIHDLPLVGGKNASLGETIRQLAPKGVNVPNGFATTAAAYRYFIERAGLAPKLQQIFADLDVNNLDNLRQRGSQARSLMLNTPFPPDLELTIATAYTQLCDRYLRQDCDSLAPIDPALLEQCLHDLDVAVRSSATAEDLPDASFAGQQENYLNVHGVKQVVEACHKCFASIFYRSSDFVPYQQRIRPSERVSVRWRTEDGAIGFSRFGSDVLDRSRNRI